MRLDHAELIKSHPSGLKEAACQTAQRFGNPLRILTVPNEHVYLEMPIGAYPPPQL